MNTSETISTLHSEAPTNGSVGVSTFEPRSDPRSPMSLGGNLGASTLSMRAKAARKRRINARHNSNFRAGYVPVEEDQLHRSGIRGRKRYFLWCVVLTLMVVTFLNIALTGWLIYLLGLTHHGMSSLELVSLGGRDFLRVFGDAQLSTVSMSGAPLGARLNSSLDILSSGAQIEIKTSAGENRSSLTLDGPNLTLTTREFRVRTKGSNQTISADLRSMAKANVIKNLSAASVTAARIEGVRDFRDKDLYIENIRNDTNISGYEEVCMDTGQDINARARSIIVEAQNEIHVDITRLRLGQQLPVVKKGQRRVRSYKLCVCAQSGRVFAVQSGKSQVSCNVGPQLARICGGLAS